MKTKLLTLTALVAAATAVSGALMIDFGSAGIGTNLGPGHAGETAGGTILTSETTWNNAFGADTGGSNGTLADLGSLVDSSGSALSGVSADFRAGSLGSFDWSAQPTGRAGWGAGGRSSTGVFANDTFRDFAAAYGSTVGVAISGLSAGDYDVWVISRNTYQNFDGVASDDYDLYVGGGDKLTTDPTTLSTGQILNYYRNDPNADTESWAVGEGDNWLKFSVTLTAGQDLLVFSESTFQNEDGLINAIQIAAVPEPSTYALALGLLAFAGILIRRRIRQ